MRRTALPRVAFAPLLLLLTTLAVQPIAAGSPPAAVGEAVEIELVSQSAGVAEGGTFEARYRLDGIAEDGSLEVVLRQRVRSRSELARSMEGEGLRREHARQVLAMASMPPDASGVRRLTLSLDPAESGVSLSGPGVYPLELIARDADLTEIDRIVSHVLVAPTSADTSPPLMVAAVAELGARPSLRPDDTIDIDADDLGDLDVLTSALTEVPDVPATVAVTPETLDALAARGVPEDDERLAAVQAAVAGRSVLRTPYVEVAADALANAGLSAELTAQLERGAEVLRDRLGATQSPTTWLARPDLGAAGLEALTTRGVTRFVVQADQLDPLDSSVLSGLSLARPFSLRPPDTGRTSETLTAPAPDAMAIDPIIVERLHGKGSPGLVASRVLAELAMLWFEQPGIQRGVILPVDGAAGADVLPLVLAGLGSGRLFEPVTLDELFEELPPLTDLGGSVVRRRLVPERGSAITSADAAQIQSLRADLSSMLGMVGVDSAIAQAPSSHLLLATADNIATSARREHLRATRAFIDELTGSVTLPQQFSITLTAREGTIPLTIGNESGEPLAVKVRFRSPRLEFPDGDVRELLLDEATTRIDIAVEARTSGAFPLEIELTTPDGLRSLATTRYSVRSTAISGVGLALSIGAGLFLLVWWARHWHRTRRSRKLVPVPAHLPGADPQDSPPAARG